MRIACWVTKATNTHSQYITLIALPLQQQLHESPSMLRYTCIACLVIVSSNTHRVLPSGLLSSGNPIKSRLHLSSPPYPPNIVPCDVVHLMLFIFAHVITCLAKNHTTQGLW